MATQTQKEIVTATVIKPKPSLKFQREKDKEPVRGMFRFHEVPGGQLSFVYKAYKGDPVEKYLLKDGQIYTLPLGVARHLNKNLKYPVHAYATDENGKPLQTIKTQKSRCSFQSLEFMDMDGMEAMGDTIIKDSL